MRWLRRKTQDDSDVPIAIRPTVWTDRFAALGSRLDDSNRTLSEVAVSFTGIEIRVSALGLDDTVYSGWDIVYAEMTVDDLSLNQPRTPRLWEQRLVGVGQFLDDKEITIANPCVLVVDGGLLINATTTTNDASELVTWHLKGGQSS